MIFFDWFLLCRFHFFQYYYPEVAPVYSVQSPILYSAIWIC